MKLGPNSIQNCGDSKEGNSSDYSEAQLMYSHLHEALEFNNCELK